MSWHDGQPVTTEDVIFSFEAPMDAEMVPMYSPFVKNIDSMEDMGNNVVDLILSLQMLLSLHQL